MINKLLVQKYEPTNIDEIVLIDRIKNKIVKDNNTQSNVLMHGSYGMGKSTLAKILIKDTASLYLNTSLNTSIDVLRTKITNHVKTISDVFGVSSNKNIKKTVFLDEFEEASPEYQKALKGFIDDYQKTTRFIFVTNHIDKINDGIKSRCPIILNFDIVDPNERKEWKKIVYERLLFISKSENINLNKNQLVNLINKKYPDIRSMIHLLNEFKNSNDLTLFEKEKLINNDTLKKISSFIIDKSINLNIIQDFILSEFGDTKISEFLNLCGRPLIETLIVENKLTDADIMGDIYSEVAYHTYIHNTINGGDPIVTAMSLINKLRKLLN